MDGWMKTTRGKKKKDGPCLVGYNLDAEGMVEKKECKG